MWQKFSTRSKGPKVGFQIAVILLVDAFGGNLKIIMRALALKAIERAETLQKSLDVVPNLPDIPNSLPDIPKNALPYSATIPPPSQITPSSTPKAVTPVVTPTAGKAKGRDLKTTLARLNSVNGPWIPDKRNSFDPRGKRNY